MKKKIAISIGDINGVGMEIIFKAHHKVTELCEPIYCISDTMLQKSAKLLNIDIPDDFHTINVDGNFEINAGKVCANAGEYSYKSFLQAIQLCENKQTDALVTLPIHKEAWMKSGLNFKGHTDLLRQHFLQDAIMMLGCEEMFVALYTEHIPLNKVASAIKKEKLVNFFLDFHKSVETKKIAVLGLNPHAGDNGVLGNEEEEITLAITEVNAKLKKEVFIGPIVPDVAFTPNFRKNFTHFIAMYHDQGLAPLKALYFEESINVSLNLPILRTSVDHGTAFDIAYKNKADTLSYINAIKYTL